MISIVSIKELYKLIVDKVRKRKLGETESFKTYYTGLIYRCTEFLRYVTFFFVYMGHNLDNTYITKQT